MEPSHCCPWWFAWTFDNPLRRLVHDPARILGPYVRPGMTVLDLGCGMGYFSLGLARLVGPAGQVLAADIQPQMLSMTMRRARRQGLDSIITPVRLEKERLQLPRPVDFALAFWVVHEIPGLPRLFGELRSVMKPGAMAMIAEPVRHVRPEHFEEELRIARDAGLVENDRPRVRVSLAAVLQNPVLLA